MKTNPILRIAASLLLATLPASARLGEDKAQLQARYGEPLKTTAHPGDYAIHTFSKNGIFIAALLKAGKTIGIGYAEAETAKPPRIDFAAAEALIKANCGEEPMTFLGTSDKEKCSVAQNPAGTLTAAYWPEGELYKLVITTSALTADATAPRLPLPEKTQLDGF